MKLPTNYLLTNHIYIYIYISPFKCVQTNDYRGSIPGQVIPKTHKMLLDAALLNAQHYKVWSNPGKGVV